MGDGQQRGGSLPVGNPNANTTIPSNSNPYAGIGGITQATLDRMRAQNQAENLVSQINDNNQKLYGGIGAGQGPTPTIETRCYWTSKYTKSISRSCK